MAKKGRLALFEFGALISAALFIAMIPIINWPFTWMMTFFHEISHGIAALVTGGKVVKINLHFKGSGLCTTVGGIRFVILFAGYIGAVIWGCLIYLMASKFNKKHTDEMAWFLIGLIVVTGIFWARDIITIAIMAIMISGLVMVVNLKNNSYIQIILKFIGIYILLDAVKAPLHLVDGRHFGDGAKLADLTGLPEFIWVLIWLAVGISGLVYLYNSAKR